MCLRTLARLVTWLAKFGVLALDTNIRLMGTLGKTVKSHIRFIDYPVTGVSASALKWDAPHKADGDIVTTSMET